MLVITAKTVLNPLRTGLTDVFWGRSTWNQCWICFSVMNGLKGAYTLIRGPKEVKNNSTCFLGWIYYTTVHTDRSLNGVYTLKGVPKRLKIIAQAFSAGSVILPYIKISAQHVTTLIRMYSQIIYHLLQIVIYLSIVWKTLHTIQIIQTTPHLPSRCRSDSGASGTPPSPAPAGCRLSSACWQSTRKTGLGFQQVESFSVCLSIRHVSVINYLLMMRKNGDFSSKRKNKQTTFSKAWGGVSPDRSLSSSKRLASEGMLPISGGMAPASEASHQTTEQRSELIILAIENMQGTYRMGEGGGGPAM